MAFTDKKVDWYRTPIERERLQQLMQRSDLRGWLQTGAHLGWFFTTATGSYLAFSQINSDTWHWALPLTLGCLFLHGTMGPFMGLIAIHELQHRTVFKTRYLNEVFEKIYAFISWSDYVWYQHSHPRHHMATCHSQHDGEVVLPVKFSLKRVGVWLGLLAWNPKQTWQRLVFFWHSAAGKVPPGWYQHVLSDPGARQQHQRWARILLVGHTLLALILVFSGYWFGVVVFTFGTFYCSWLGFLCGVTQHYGLNPDVPDFRYNTRTFTCSKLVGFYYWNMQYHLEHHMYPSVPFYNLPKLREALAYDLPEAPHGLLATWKEMLALKRRVSTDPDYRWQPKLPSSV